ncbi:hypothetical protein HID58_093718, partial [Brassica napus]
SLDGEDRVLDESEASHELFFHVRNLSVGAVLIAVVHTLHGFRNECFTTILSRADILMHKLNVMFPSSAPKARSMLPLKPLMSSKSF